MARDINEVRQEIDETFERFQDATHYDILGVDREDFEASKLAGIYRQLAKKWHVDRYSSYDLDASYKGKLQKIFAAINNANRTLSNPQKREEYDAELDAVDAADVAELINADTYFLRGKNMLQQGSYKGAFDMFEKAYQINEENETFYIYYLYTEYLNIPKTEDGKPLKITRAQEIYDELTEFEKEMEDIDWIKVFVGVVALGLGKDKRAEYMFRQALLYNSNNADAKRYKRLIEMRKEREANKGFFAKLMDKFKGG